MNFREITPNDFVDGTIGPRILVRKPVRSLEGIHAGKLPFKVDESNQVGVGDWSSGRSENGAVVLGIENKDWVVKLPLGKMKSDTRTCAISMKDTAGRFEDVSPRTHVIIADVDGNGPKPVVLQEKIEGRPLCKTPILEITDTEKLMGIKRIIGRAKEVYCEKGMVDLSGQQYINLWASRAASFLIFLSDNIMTDENGVYLADNTPDCEQHRPKAFKSRLMQNLRFGIQKMSVDMVLTMVKISRKIKPGNMGKEVGLGADAKI